MSKMDTPGGMQELTVINESGDDLVCGIQTVKEVFGSFDGLFSDIKTLCDLLGDF